MEWKLMIQVGLVPTYPDKTIHEVMVNDINLILISTLNS